MSDRIVDGIVRKLYGPELKDIYEEQPVSHMQQSPTLYERLWQAMDDAYAELQDTRAASRGREELVGQCRGLAKALAIFSAPMDYDGVRAEAHRRWQSGESGFVTTRTKTKRELRRQP